MIEQILDLLGMTSNERVIASEAKQAVKSWQSVLLNLYSLLRFARNDSFVWFKFRTSLLSVPSVLSVFLLRNISYLGRAVSTARPK